MRFHPCLVAAAWLIGAAIAQAQPVDLRPYPKAQELARYDNPLEVGALPISPPERADGKNASRWRLPYEGKVSMQQYKHPADDSPLLIARHYAGLLREQGFELVTICDFPCAGRSGSQDVSIYWSRELDPAKRLQYSAFGTRGMYLMAHRADAVVAVRVGSFGDGYASVVKTVTASKLDRAPLLAYLEQQQAPAADSPLPPPPGRTAAAPAAIDSVSPADVAAWVRQSKGWLVVHFSSYDPGCGFCVRSNPAFNALAEAEANSGLRFARVAFQPWKSVGQSEFVRQLGVGGIPAYFTFKDGQLMRRVDGIADEATLRRSLLEGLR